MLRRLEVRGGVREANVMGWWRLLLLLLCLVVWRCGQLAGCNPYRESASLICEGEANRWAKGSPEGAHGKRGSSGAKCGDEPGCQGMRGERGVRLRRALVCNWRGSASQLESRLFS